MMIDSKILFALMILLTVWALLQILQKIKPEAYTRVIRRDDLNVLLGKGSQSELGKRDCNVEVLYAMDDEQCGNICRAPGIFQVRNGACVNVLAFESKGASKNTCDAKQGVLAYLVGNSQFGSVSLLCLSIDLGIQPDDAINGKNRICSGDGSIDIDYLLGFPQIADCRCPKNKSLLTFVEGTSTVRAYGQCTTDSLKPVFEYNRLLYTANPI